MALQSAKKHLMTTKKELKLEYFHSERRPYYPTTKHCDASSFQSGALSYHYLNAQPASNGQLQNSERLTS